MIRWVWEAARRALRLDELLVATDDKRIYDTVEGFGGRVCMTDARHASGTDRLAEAAADSGAGIAVNIQGDEPLMDPGLIDAVVAPLLEDAGLSCCTAVTHFRNLDELRNPDTAKVILDAEDRALYFSRAVIPHPRDGAPDLDMYHKHVGIYAYRAAFLECFTRLSSRLEEIERLEQLRMLEHGVVVRAVRVPYQPLGVDREGDIAAVERELERRGLSDT